jgi:hypothetical protein
MKEPDHRHRGLLRSRCNRPRRRTAEQRDKLAAVHRCAAEKRDELAASHTNSMQRLMSK